MKRKLSPKCKEKEAKWLWNPRTDWKRSLLELGKTDELDLSTLTTLSLTVSQKKQKKKQHFFVIHQDSIFKNFSGSIVAFLRSSDARQTLGFGMKVKVDCVIENHGWSHDFGTCGLSASLSEGPLGGEP